MIVSLFCICSAGGREYLVVFLGGSWLGRFEEGNTLSGIRF